ncbi:DNA translocase FtsK [Bacillus sp. NTK074B]|uniref:DNA translocase FtsK n=1 Tax=Bacillus sp. NTK074B TaxID=2802174 RepID=UPI001A8DE211|nr:DNA translocase FtsK [Bacillus sp. NTK074B]
MSWIKKIFGKLSDDEEQFEEYYDENDNDVQQIEPQKTERKHIAGPNHSRDIEARMTYQYPKGNFRFPLISDGEAGERPRRERRHQKVEEKPKEQKSKSQNQSTSKRNWKEESPAPTVHTKKTLKVEKGNSRPFTPTEIPSPIYGFKNRPIKKEESVEYELKKFLHNEEEKKEAIIDHKALEIAEDSVPLGNTTDESAVQEIREEPSDIPSIQDQVVKGIHEKEAEYQEPLVHENHVEEMDYQNRDGLQEIGKEETEHHEYKEKEMEDSSKTSGERITLITDLTKEEPDVSRDHEQVHEVDSPVGTSTDLETTDEVTESSAPEEETIDEEPGVEGSSPENEREGVESKEPIKEEPQRRKRSHLPFNVLMLKQDKRQMDTRKATAVPFMEKQRTAAESEQKSPVQEARRETPAEAPRQSDEKPAQPSQVQGEEAVKSYSELSSSSKKTRDYAFPEMDYLMPPVSKEMSEEWLDSQRLLLDETLHNFNVKAKVVNVTQGPSVTRFEVQPDPGVKVNKITNLTDDIKLSLAAKDIRMEAPIPGKHTIGIEVPNRESRPVCISEVIASPAFQEPTSPLTAALGLDISGQPIVTDLSKMPHGLIAGATGSGKSVCINSILVSLLYKASPDELKMLLIDPKMVELAPYNRIPHLVSPVITDVKAATAALKWAVEEMERRYELFAHTGVRDIKRFNELAKRNGQYSDMLPYLVIVIDELADLMMMSPADVEEAICRIAQKARACGIHLIIATQRPSVDVITGLIKANVPTRVAFSVSSSVDSRTIIDGSGAERLLGKGDMLFLENGSSKPVRLQGTFVSDDEIDDIIRHVREQREPDYLFQQDELIKKAQVTEEEDELFLEACEFVVDQGGASASSLQRRFRIGYNRAARLMEMMESNGIISESRGSKPRDVLISESELETLA